MDDTDRIVAAIFTLGLCQGKPMQTQDYLRIYDECLEIFRAREEAAKKERAEALREGTKAMLKNPKPYDRPRR